MSTRKHIIELEDTSASEMARFRRIMIGIWRQQIEDDKNAGEMEKFVKEDYRSTRKSNAEKSKEASEISLKEKHNVLSKKQKNKHLKNEKGRIYSSFGKFIEEIKNGNKILVTTDQGLKYLSELDYTKKGTTYAVTRIIAYEAKEIGYTGWFGVKKMDDEGTIAHTTSTKNRTVFFNSIQLKKGLSDNFYDMRSTLHHEADKIDGHRSEKPTGNYTFLQHAKVYFGQTKAKDFYKSSEKNQENAITGFVLRAIKAEAEGTRELTDMINDFNTFHKGKYYIEHSFNGLTYSNFTIYNFIAGKSQFYSQEDVYKEIKDLKPEG